MTAFSLTPEQIAALDAEPSDIGRTVLLQVWHQRHCFENRDYSVFGMIADPAVFSRWWLDREAEHMAEAREVYHNTNSNPEGGAMPVGCARSGYAGEKDRHFPSPATERREQRTDCARRDSRRDGTTSDTAEAPAMGEARAAHYALGVAA